MFVSFSIVTTIHEGSNQDLVKESLLSCMDNEEYFPKEIIVVGDGVAYYNFSDYPKYLQDRLCFIPSVKLGLAGCLNLGIANSSTEIIARIDTDDYCLSGRFDKQIPFMIENNLIICGGHIRRLDIESGDLAIAKAPLTDFCIRIMVWKTPFFHPTVIFKKKEFLKCGSYNPELMRRQDYDLWFRFIKLGRCMNVNEELVVYRYNRRELRSLNSVIGQIKIGFKASVKSKMYLLALLPSLLIVKWLFECIRFRKQ